MKIISLVIGLFIMQILLEVLVMVILVRLGIPYMDFKATGETFGELLGGILYYYSLSKVIVIVLPYVLIVLITYRYIHKNLGFINFLTSTVLTVLFWIYFDNPMKEIINPAFGTMIAGALIIFITTFRKHLSLDRTKLQ